MYFTTCRLYSLAVFLSFIQELAWTQTYITVLQNAAMQQGDDNDENYQCVAKWAKWLYICLTSMKSIFLSDVDRIVVFVEIGIDNLCWFCWFTVTPIQWWPHLLVSDLSLQPVHRSRIKLLNSHLLCIPKVKLTH